MGFPCKNCERRHPACWGDCEVYRQYRKHYDETKDEMHRKMEARDFLSDSFAKKRKRKNR